ncbi:MAG: hypothetical protein WD602_05860 [Actinomycetota bacterium]
MSQREKNLQQKVMDITESQSEISTITAGQLEIDLIGYQARFKRTNLELSTSQLEVLAILIASRRICSRTELSESLGLYGARTIDMILSKLRQQVDRDFIRNVHSLGWIVDTSMLKD